MQHARKNSQLEANLEKQLPQLEQKLELVTQGRVAAHKDKEQAGGFSTT